MSSLSAIIIVLLPEDPRTRTISGFGVSSYEWVAPKTKTPLSVTIGCGLLLINRISTSGMKRNTLYGPITSKAVIPLNRTICYSYERFLSSFLIDFNPSI
jgi:hypothetical protein